MEMEKRLVVISAGVELPPLILEFLQAGIGFTLILNTTADFALPNKEEKDTEEVWYHHEIVKLASAIVPDDLTKSSLAKIFSQPIAQTRIPLSDTEMFLVQWVSERKKANQSFYEFFKALNEYAGKSLEVYPLKFPEEVITIKTPTSQVPLRYFQITGFVDRIAEQKTDLEELQTLLVEDQESKDKKKEKSIQLVGLNLERDILTEETKKIITEADAILWLAEDPCSLALLLLHKEFTKAVKESKAPATLISPRHFTFREQFILQLLGVKPTLLGIAELCSGIVDNFVVGPDEASEVTSLRSKGFNVIMEDISKIKDKKGLLPILKSMGVSIKDISVESEEVDVERTLEDLVTQLSYKAEQVSDTEEIEATETSVSSEEEIETVTEVESEVPGPTVELLDTEPKNYDFDDTSLALTQEMIEGLMQELSDEFPATEQQSTVVIEEEVLNSTLKENEKESSIQYESQEAFTEAIQTLLKSETIDSESELVQGIGEAISKNADMANYAAKKLTAALETQHIKLIPIYVDFLKPRPLPFTKELLDWLITDLESPDFVAFAQKVTLIISISKYDTQFIEQLLKQLVDYQITKSLSPIEREHVRTLIGMISARNVTLQRRAIRAYLSHYETPGIKPDEVWLGLVKFDAGLVALEIIEHQSEFGVKLIQEVLSRNLGSFGHIIYDVFHAYQKGDLQRVLAVAGILSDALMRKKQREELAARIRKIGSVPIETLAKTVELDPKELEELVYEMINQNEINAKIDVIEGRLCIVQLNDKEKVEMEEK